MTFQNGDKTAHFPRSLYRVKTAPNCVDHSQPLPDQQTNKPRLNNQECPPYPGFQITFCHDNSAYYGKHSKNKGQKTGGNPQNIFRKSAHPLPVGFKNIKNIHPGQNKISVSQYGNQRNKPFLHILPKTIKSYKTQSIHYMPHMTP